MNRYILFLFLVLFCQQNGYAQISELQPFMSGEAEPEMFFMDPVYNEKGEIMHYSYGGILKVQYEYNEDGSPRRKMAYIIDKHDCDWAILAVTNFSYKDGRLQQEQTRHHFSDESPLFITTKTIFYDPYSHTDTIRNSMEKITRHRVPGLPSDDMVTTTVRYLNKYNQPDSIITTERYKRGDILGREDSDERTDLYRMVKVHYDYDSKKRLKSGHAFFQSGFDTIWHDSYNFKVDYHKNKTEWIQISKGIDIEAYREYGHVEEIETTLKYVITTDSKNRILSKSLTANEDMILSSKYSYDSTGKQTANIELNMKSKYIESLGMSDMLMKGFGNKIDGIDYTVHSKDNCMHTEFHLKMEGEEEKKLHLTICSNGEDGLLSTVDFVRYDDGEIDDKRHSTFQHLADGLIERIEYYVYYEDEESSLEPRHCKSSA